VNPADIRVPTRATMQATLQDPGGRDRLYRMQSQVQGQRDEAERRGQEFTAQLEAMRQGIEDIRGIRDTLDGCLADLAEVLGEIQP